MKISKKGYLLWGLGGLCVLLFLLALDFVLLPKKAVPTFEEVRSGHTRSESILLDRHGEILQELRTNSRNRRLEWVQLQDISPRRQHHYHAAGCAVEQRITAGRRASNPISEMGADAPGARF